jgi:hypothetical protein
MLTWKAWAAWLLLFIAGFLYLVGSSPSFQECIGHAQSQANNQTLQEGVSNFLIVIGGTRRCLETNQAGIGALATIAIAFFTGTLWWSTSYQGRLTQEALVVDKRAFVFASGFNPFWEADAAGNYAWRH